MVFNRLHAYAERYNSNRIASRTAIVDPDLTFRPCIAKSQKRVQGSALVADKSYEVRKSTRMTKARANATEELKTVCSFKPSINERSRILAGKSSRAGLTAFQGLQKDAKRRTNAIAAGPVKEPKKSVSLSCDERMIASAREPMAAVVRVSRPVASARAIFQGPASFEVLTPICSPRVSELGTPSAIVSAINVPQNIYIE